MPKGAKVDRARVDNVTRQIQKSSDQLAKMQTKLQNPDLTEEEVAELEQACADFQAKIDRLSASTGSTGSTTTP